MGREQAAPGVSSDILSHDSLILSLDEPIIPLKEAHARSQRLRFGFLIQEAKDRKRKSSPKVFCTKFFCTPWDHGRLRIRVMDIHTQMLVFQGFEALREDFDPGRRHE